MPTFYVSAINPNSTSLDADGVFTGSITTQPVTNSTTKVQSVLTNTAQSFFKFFTALNTTSDADATTIDVTGVGGVTGTFAFTAPDTTRSNEFVSLLATEVFGSGEANDLFSNLAAIHTSWDTATGTTALGLLNGLVNTAGVAASNELVDAMFVASNGTTNRFTLPYKATSGTGIIVSGNDLVVSSTSGSGASVDITTVPVSLTTSTNLVGAVAHGYSNGNTVSFADLVTTDDIAINTTYYVISSLTDSFQLALTASGAAITFAATGTALIITKVSIATEPVVFTASTDLVTANAHGYADTNTVIFTTVGATSALSVDTTYYVISSTTNTFQVALTSGGAAIALSNDGVGLITKYGSGYVKNETATVTGLDSSSAAATFTLVLNSVQAAMLNGSLNAVAGTEVPLEVGDKIRVLYTITSKDTQTDTSSDGVTATQTFFTDYLLTAA